MNRPAIALINSGTYPVVVESVSVGSVHPAIVTAGKTPARNPRMIRRASSSYKFRSGAVISNLSVGRCMFTSSRVTYISLRHLSAVQYDLLPQLAYVQHLDHDRLR